MRYINSRFTYFYLLTSAKLDFRRNRIWTIPHIWEPIVFIPTKLRENHLIWDRDMPRKRNSERAFWRRNSTSGFNFDKCHFSETFLCMILENFKKITQCAAELYATLLFLYLPLYLHCKRHNDTVPSCRASVLHLLNIHCVLKIYFVCNWPQFP